MRQNRDTPQENGWKMGFAYSFAGPASSEAAPEVIAPELIEAFNEGRLVEQRYAIEGLPFDPQCFDLSEEGAHIWPADVVYGVHVVTT